ncbi:MAG TPA: hypothetical protein VGC21_03815 [Telluria sp.]
MDAASRTHILALARQAHALTESAYTADPATKGQPGWSSKQRVLLADMALHLVQSALREGDIDTTTLSNNLYSILTISAPFLPAKGLDDYADAIIQP